MLRWCRRCAVFFGMVLASVLALVVVLLLASSQAQSFFVQSFSVDPSLLISSRVLQRLLPAYLEKDLQVLRNVCSATESKFDILRRELIVRNFTIDTTNVNRTDQTLTSAAADGTEIVPAFRVGHLNISWDSYLRPCLALELSEVDIAVEFTNVLLSRTNWHELNDHGFPPPLLTGYEVEEEDSSEETSSIPEKRTEVDSNTVTDKYIDYLIEEGGVASNSNTDDVTSESSSYFIRIGSLDLSGNVTLRVTSRPLGGKDVAKPFAFDLKTLDQLSKQIEHEAAVAELSSGRKGCTVDTAYDVVLSYVLKKLEQILAQTVFDISIFGKESAPVQRAKTLLSSAENLAKDYASSVSGVAEKKARERLGDVQGKFLDRLRLFGMNEDKVEAARRGSNTIAKTTAGLLSAALRERWGQPNNKGSGNDDEL